MGACDDVCNSKKNNGQNTKECLKIPVGQQFNIFPCWQLKIQT